MRNTRQRRAAQHVLPQAKNKLRSLLRRRQKHVGGIFVRRRLENSLGCFALQLCVVLQLLLHLYHPFWGKQLGNNTYTHITYPYGIHFGFLTQLKRSDKKRI